MPLPHQRPDGLFRALPLVMVLILCGMGRGAAVAGNLYVFFPSTIQPQYLQEKLSAACRGVNVLVFGRHRDFISMTGTTAPDAVLIRPELLSRLPGYTKRLDGVRNGAIREKWLLVSVDTGLDLSRGEELTIGCIDFMGRKSTESFVQAKFSIKPRVKRVTKIEDLIPLLTFGMSDGVLIQESLFAYFTEASNLQFITQNLINSYSGILCAATSGSPAGNAIITDLENFDNEMLQLLKIEGWK